MQMNRRQLLLGLLSLIPFLGLKAYLDKKKLAEALSIPLRDGLFKDDCLNKIFVLEELAPGTGPDYYAYTVPGRIPNKTIYGEPVVISIKDASYAR
jgi:hypothetical protein